MCLVIDGKIILIQGIGGVVWGGRVIFLMDLLSSAYEAHGSGFNSYGNVLREHLGGEGYNCLYTFNDSRKIL